MTEHDLDEIDQWASIDEDSDEVALPSVVDMNLETVSKMMRAVHRLYGQIGEYEQLHVAEQARIDAARERAVGPLVRRVHHLESVLYAFAVKAFRDSDRTRIATPNGVITSRATKPKLDVDQAAGGWLHELHDQAATQVWSVDKAKARKLIDHLVETGVLERVVVRETGPGGEYDVIGVREIPRGPLVSQVGRFRIVSTGRIVEGLSWDTTGMDGVGRNFHLEVG